MRWKRIIPAVAVLGVLAAPVAAQASVQLDPATGLGFVGKGDVQTPFGWNDQKLQQNAPGVTFRYDNTKDDAYAITCEWDTGNRQIVHHVQHKSGNVTDTVAYDVSKADRKNPNGKVTGFNLAGLANLQETSDGAVPVVGDDCPATGNEESTDSSVEKKITDVELVSSTNDEHLTASYAGESHQLNWPAPVEAAPTA